MILSLVLREWGFSEARRDSEESGVVSDRVASARREAAAETLLQKSAQAEILLAKSAKADFRTKSYIFLLKNVRFCPFLLIKALLERFKAMKYILTYTSIQKNAKRHIFKRFNTLEECEKFALRYIDGKYDLDIYTSDWVLVKKLNH